jgi:tRNA G18 (ribose-2'-O)-methylase SpoU
VIEPLATIDDPRVADYRAMRDADLLRARGLFVAEGRLVVERVIADRRYRIRSVLVSETAARALGPVLADLHATVPVYTCRADDFLPLTGYNLHRGCLALVERPEPLTLGAAIAGASLIVALEGVGNADNVGGVFRNAAAFMLDAVVLDAASCDPLYRKAIRTSMGAVLQVPFARVLDWAAGLAALRRAGFAVVALTPRSPAESIDAFTERGMPAKIALFLGAEGSGLSDATIAAADARVRIPISARIDSLNIAVAAGIALQRLAHHVRGVRL